MWWKRSSQVAVKRLSSAITPGVRIRFPSSLQGAWKKSSVWNTISISSMPCRERPVSRVFSRSAGELVRAELTQVKVLMRVKLYSLTSHTHGRV